MNVSKNKFYVTISFVIIFSGCMCPKPQSPAHISEEQKKLSPDQRQLNYGYSIIYNAAQGLQWTKKILIVKKESAALEDIVNDLDQTCKKIEIKFQDLQKNYPNLKLDDSGRPNVLEMKNREQVKDRFMDYAPIIGIRGAYFERTLLLHLSGAMNELKYLSEQLEKLEANEGLKNFLVQINSETTRLEDRMLKMLNKKYFKQNFFSPQKNPKN